jgi:hypothetical protein
MQIHELSEHLGEATSITGVDTTKVSSHVAAQIKKAEDDSQAKLAQQAKQAVPTAAANPFGQMASSLRSPPTPAGPVATSTGGTATRTATGTRHTAAAANPNVAAQPTAATPQNTAKPSWLDKTKAVGNATAAGWKQGGFGGAIKNNLSWDPYNTELDKITHPATKTVARNAPAAPQATLMAKLAPTGITQKGLAAAGQVLQQLGNGNRTLKKTGDRNVDAMLSSMGYTLQ